MEKRHIRMEAGHWRRGEEARGTAGTDRKNSKRIHEESGPLV